MAPNQGLHRLQIGGGVSDKYKHMIYVDAFCENRFVITDLIHQNEGTRNDYFIAYDYGCIYIAYQSIDFYDKKNLLCYISKYKLKEGDYMSYMGHIYDYQGNIVE